MPLTPEEVHIKLGLLPFDEFAAKNYDERMAKALSSGGNMDEFLRQTGRSTKIYCDLLAHISSGNKVVFVSVNPMIGLRKEMEITKLADKLDLDATLIIPIYGGVNNTDRLRGIDPAIIFYDHPMP